MINNKKIYRARRFLVILEFIEAIEAAFILGLITFLCSVIELSYMLNTMYFMFVMSSIFLYTSLKGIFKYYRDYTKVMV